MANMDRLDRVVSDLERDQNLRRIKKLLYCSCYGVWEDSPARLEQVALREIVQGVWERSPTLDALQFQLNRIVKTLNKPVEYAHVANAVLRVMTQLYRDTYDITRPLHRPASNSTSNAAITPASAPPATQWLGAEPHHPAALSPVQLEAQAIQALSSHAETTRLKKLLICVCKNYWESDPSRLVTIGWGDLLQETQDLIPTLENLDYVLQAIVKSLSKPLDYLPIASTLLQSVRPLYENRPKPTETLFYGIENSPVRAPEPTEFYAAPAAAPGVPHSAAVARPMPDPSLDEPATGPLNPISHEHMGDEVPTGLLSSMAPSSLPAPPPAPSVPSPSPASPELFQDQPERFPPSLLEGAAPLAANTAEPTTADPALLEALQRNLAAESLAPNPSVSSDTGEVAALVSNTRPSDTAGLVPQVQQDEFGLRLEIMRYANPLMVKIVVFSTIHRLFRFSEQDWTELRHHTLNGLLTTLRKNYPNFTDLETKLCITAEQIELQENALKTVAAILKVLKPYYGNSDGNQPARQFTLLPSPSNSLEDDLAILAAALDDEDEADENSCQVF